MFKKWPVDSEKGQPTAVSPGQFGFFGHERGFGALPIADPAAMFSPQPPKYALK